MDAITTCGYKQIAALEKENLKTTLEFWHCSLKRAPALLCTLIFVNPPKIVFWENLFSRIRQKYLFHVHWLSRIEHAPPPSVHTISWKKISKTCDDFCLREISEFQVLNNIIYAILISDIRQRSTVFHQKVL